MTETDDKLLKQFFGEQKQEIEDNGFSRRVMRNLPGRNHRLVQVWGAGTYDKFAINWAYRWLDTETPQEELPILNEWIQEHEGDLMYWYGEQQDPKDPIDPRSQDEDLGDDIVKANRYGIMNLKRIVPNIVAWTEEDGESFAEAGKLLMAVINQWKMYAGHVTANV